MALDLSKDFNIDQNKEISGVWENLDGGARVLVARAGNDKYTEEYNRIPRAIRRKLENNTLGTMRRDEIICDIMSKTILLDFENIADGGREVKYSPANAKQMLIKYPEFRDFIFQLSNDATRFSAYEAEGDEDGDDDSSSD